MAAALVAYRGAGRFRPAAQVGHQFLDGLSGEFGMRGHGGVEVVYIGLVVLVVVQVHGFGVNTGLQCIVSIGQGRKCERAGSRCGRRLAFRESFGRKCFSQ